MAGQTKRDLFADPDGYLVGNSEAEAERLERQHLLFLPHCIRAWDAMGLKSGDAVLDVGAGPGAASMDLARRVGLNGLVVALERNSHFASHCQKRAAVAGLSQVAVHCADVLLDPLPQGPFDLIWCRWLAVFVGDAERLVERLVPLLKPGGSILFLETIDWSTLALYGCSPGDQKAIAEFADLLHQSISQAGGDPVVARRLPRLFSESGLRLTRLDPLILAGQAEVFGWLYAVIDLMGGKLVSEGLWSSQAREDALRTMRSASGSAGAYSVGPLQIWIQATSARD